MKFNFYPSGEAIGGEMSPVVGSMWINFQPPSQWQQVNSLSSV